MQNQNQQGRRRFRFDSGTALALVYLLIAVATFKHTMWAGSMTFEGPYPTTGTALEQFWWILSGIFVAVAIDAGMMTTAHILPHVISRRQAIVFAGAFIVAAAASLYTQLMYSAAHTSAFEFGVGVTDYWRGMLQPLLEARTVLIAAFLPTFAIVYTLARITVNDQPVEPTIVDRGDNAKLMTTLDEITKPRSRRRLGGKAARVAAQLNPSGAIVGPQLGPKAATSEATPSRLQPLEGEVVTFGTNGSSERKP